MSVSAHKTEPSKGIPNPIPHAQTGASCSTWDFLKGFYERVAEAERRARSAETRSNNMTQALQAMGKTQQQDRINLNTVQIQMNHLEAAHRQTVNELHLTKGNLNESYMDSRVIREALEHEKVEHEESMRTIQQLHTIIEHGDSIVKNLQNPADKNKRPLSTMIQELLEPEIRSNREAARENERLWQEKSVTLEERDRILVDREATLVERERLFAARQAAASTDEPGSVEKFDARRRSRHRVFRRS